MAQIKKTNAIRILENLKIPYEAKEYDDDGEHPLAKGAAGRTAEKLGVDPATVYKTIVMRTETKELCVFLQSSLHEINLKKARNAACSPLGMKKKLRTFIDSSALELEKINISAGVRGMQLTLAPQDLVKACDAEVVDLIL